MELESIVNKLIGIILFPPGINLILFTLGYFLLNRFRKLALSLLTLSFSSLFILALPVVSNSLINDLQTHSALTQSQVKSYANQQERNLAIVVLSGGRISLAPEYGDIDTVSSFTLQRIQYAAWLHRKTKLPILVSGGSILDQATPEGVLMNQAMVSAFNIAPKWIEFKSKNTAENAQFSADILAENNINEILLVTHAIHMQRAKIAFEQQGLKVVVAPTVFQLNKNKWSDYLPTSKALHQSQQALHEMLGRFWYSIKC